MRETATARPQRWGGTPSPRRRLAWLLAAVLGLSLLVSACLLVSYVSFKYPIKTDRYRHGFFERVPDRLLAYAFVLRSPLRWHNAGMPVEAIQQIIREKAGEHGVETCLVEAVVIFESGFNANTITTTGAMGLMALQPETAKTLGVDDPYDPQQNVDGGTRLLKGLLAEFDGDVSLALAGYNAGTAAIERYGGVPPYRETRDYVDHVGKIYSLCRAQPALFSATP